MKELISVQKSILRIGGKKSGFRYLCAQKKQIKNPVILKRIKNLVIPPAWKDVKIAIKSSAPIQAVGRDSEGRRQYIYNPVFRAKREKEKFLRIIEFANRLPEMRRITSSHLHQSGLTKEKVMAAMVRLVETAFFRVGGEEYAKKHQVYGISTLRKKHLQIKGNEMIFHYMGKWGKQQKQSVVDTVLQKIVAECARLPGVEIFKYYDADKKLRDVKTTDLNRYLKEVIGREFSIKDFRTWAGTLVAAVTLAKLGPAKIKKEAEKNLLAAIDEVAKQLGNTRAIAKSSYINPRIFEHYLEGTVLKYYSRKPVSIIVSKQFMLTREEKALLSLLARKLSHKVAWVLKRKSRPT